MRPRAIADPAIEAYLAAVAARLIGPRGTRAAILDELRDGLQTAAATRRTRGLTPDAAVREALAEFGSAPEVAVAFTGELVTARARQISLSYLLTGPLVGVSWLLVLAPPGWWREGPRPLLTSLPAIPLVAVGCLAGLTVLAATGRLGRWIRLTPRHLLDATALLALTCIAGDAVVLTLLGTDPTHPAAGAIAAVAATSSIARTTCGVAVIAHCRRVRHTVIA
ncbi:permease prefix domain 1-containing protein [Pseudonocardia sp. CA-107938]|uniref:permease prefix domain 1-containing protein n=1 Tax=Pseudonocardia sp. CA-107938 TaxID=3240021 RepID=UPI003D90C9B3